MMQIERPENAERRRRWSFDDEVLIAEASFKIGVSVCSVATATGSLRACCSRGVVKLKKPINEWAGGDVDRWTGSMRAALDWDAATPSGFTSKEKHAAELRTVRNGLDGLVTLIAARRSEIPAERARNGLENWAP